MASTGKHRLTRGRQVCVVAALMAAVAGCASMPDSGPVGTYGANQENTAPAPQYVGPFVSGPGPHWAPWEIVQGFLDASASYPTDPSIAKEYLISSAGSKWDPGSVVVFNQLSVPPKAQMSRQGRHGPLQAQVTATGAEQGTVNGFGQYISAPAQGQSAGSYNFKLIQEGGQWRISNPPNYRLLTVTVFPQVYQARDLYFVDPSDKVLVPDSVFVPRGASPEDLAKNLVMALSQDPSAPWLQDAADTEFPTVGAGTKVLSVVLNGAVAVVDLGGAVANASQQTLGLISAQLVWTLVGLQTSPPPAVQSVELEINGHVKPLASPCGTGQTPSIVQKLASYECYDPYPPAPASFYYANGGLAWSRCGSAQQGLIGPVAPVVGRTGVLSDQQCGGPLVRIQSAAGPPAQPSSLPAMSMAAVSPNGKYLALVSPNQNAVYVGPFSGGAASFPDTPRLTGSHISALSWDRDGNLWVAQGDTIWTLPAEGSFKWPVGTQFPGQVTAFSVAPDGVRLAAIVQTGSGSELELAAIKPSQGGQAQRESSLFYIGQSVQLGPNLADPVTLTWYDADDLIVLEAAKTGNTLWQVPVDGQQANELQTPPGVVSIAADGAANYLVAGLTGGKLDVSAGLDGPWQPLAANGQDPSYPG